VGAVRSHNEDNFIVGERVWAVADGMGGQAAGEIASSIVAARLRDFDVAGELGEADVVSLVKNINDEILDYGRKNRQAEGLGSTVTGLLSINLGGTPHWLVFNVGDSRVYHFADGRLTCKTIDHNEAAELVRMGEISEEQARKHPGRSILTRSLGQSITPMPDMLVLPQQPDELFVICSDGLNSEVSDCEIAQVLKNGTEPAWVATQLVQLAIKNGGHDNVTVVVVNNAKSESNKTQQIDLDDNTIPNLELQALRYE
jgi:protein phosphatase